MNPAAPDRGVVISPEIALVDPELAAEARRALRPPEDCLARGGRRTERSRNAEAPDGDAPERRPSLRVAVVSLLIASLVGVPRGWGGTMTAGGRNGFVSPAAAGLTHR